LISVLKEPKESIKEEEKNGKKVGEPSKPEKGDQEVISPKNKPSLDKVQKEGWLDIRGFRVWNKRWFVVSNGYLLYYKAVPDKALTSELWGMINLEGCDLRQRAKQMGAPVILLEIVHPEKNLYFVKLDQMERKLV